MKLLKKAALSFFASATLFCGVAMADSPLTSTAFTGDYTEFDIIQDTVKNKVQTLTNEQAAFLTSTDVPAGARAALVNALSWNFDGQKNARLFLNYLQNKDVTVQATASAKELLGKATPEEVALYAYLLAMDDYFNVENALGWASQAKQGNPNSLTINMINALLESQYYLDDGNNWCKVYKAVDEVRNNSDLNNDFKPEAINSIFDYIEIYQEYCK